MSNAFVDQVETTLSAGISDSATAWPLTSGTGFPNPPDDNTGTYWVWVWDEGTYANPKDDPNAERSRAVSISGNTLTVVRGEDGQTAVAHSSGDTVAILADRANIQSLYGIDVTPFGGDTAGTSDATAAVQAALDDAVDARRPLYIPAGEFRIDGTLTYNHAAARQLHIVGDGMYNSILKDNNTSGPFLDINKENVHVKMRDLRIEIGGNKHAHYSMEIGTGKTDCRFDDVYWDGNNVGMRALLFIDDAWNFTFTNCFWQNYGGIAIDFRATRNAGNMRFLGGKFNFGRAPLFTRDGSTVDGINFVGTKFVGNHAGDWLTHSSLSTFTLGATTINVGTGRNTASGLNHQLVISNDNQQEIHTVASYTSGTGDLVLETGLEFDWSGDSSAELFIGSPGPVLTNRSTSVTFSSCHFEQTPPILSRADGVVFTGCLFNIMESVADNGATWSTTATPLNTHCLYVTGAHARNIVLVGCRYTTDRSDDKMIYCVDPAGVSAVPGDITMINVGSISGGSVSRNINPITATSASTQQIVMTGNDIYLGQKSGRIGGGATGTAQVEIDQIRSGAIYDTVNVSGDANYGFGAGIAADDNHVDVNGPLTAARTVTLPVSPQIGRLCLVSKSDSTGNNVTVSRNGQFINGVASDTVFNTQHQMHFYKYIGGNTGWLHWIEN